MDGKWKIIFTVEGHEYEGQFYNNQINGHWSIKWNNEDMYEGEKIDRKIYGLGKYTF